MEKDKSESLKKKRGGGIAAKTRSVTLSREELMMWNQKNQLVSHFDQCRRAALVDLQVFQNVIKDRYQLPADITIDYLTGVITAKAQGNE